MGVPYAGERDRSRGEPPGRRVQRMYEKVLVPLDGSRVAEGILPTVAWLARGL